MTGPTVIVADLDGTVCDFKGAIPDATRRIVDDYSLSGVPVICATVRRLSSARKTLGLHGLSLPLVCLQGALVAAADGSIVWAEPIPEACVRACLTLFSDCGLEPIGEIAPDPAEILSPDRPSLPDDHIRQSKTYVRRIDWRTLRPTEPILCLRVASPDHGLLDRLVSELAIDCRIRTNNRPVKGTSWRLLTVQRASATKWESVKRLCSILQVSADGAVSISDDLEDLPVLEQARWGIAIKGSALALEHGDYPQTSGPGDGGWHDLATALAE